MVRKAKIHVGKYVSSYDLNRLDHIRDFFKDSILSEDLKIFLRRSKDKIENAITIKQVTEDP